MFGFLFVILFDDKLEIEIGWDFLFEVGDELLLRVVVVVEKWC